MHWHLGGGNAYVLGSLYYTQVHSHLFHCTTFGDETTPEFKIIVSSAKDNLDIISSLT